MKGPDAVKGDEVMKQLPCVLGDIKKLLLIYLTERQLTGDMVTKTIICQNTKTLHDNLIKMPGLSAKDKFFNASQTWFKNFKRTGIYKVVCHGEAVGSCHKAAGNFAPKFKRLMDSGGYLPQLVFNCNKTAFLGDGEENARSQDQLILLFYANVNGDFKVKPLPIYYLENPQTFKKSKVQKSQLNVMWKSNSKGGMT